MENASKALIIAGSILITLLLINIAIMTYNSVTGLGDQGKSIRMSQEAISSNSRFSQYFGNKVSGSDVISFLQLVIVNNSQTGNTISIDFRQSSTTAHSHRSSSLELQEIINMISRSSNYSIGINSSCPNYSNGYRNDGYYGCITIQKK